jgi:hypothetical protein
MRTQPARFRSILAFFAFFLLLPLRLSAQTSPAPSTAPANRIIQAVDESKLTVLKGNTYFMARPQYDRGAAPGALSMNRMLLVLRRSRQQEATLEQLLDQQQDQSSPNYHKWLTPEQFGQQFGPSDQDIQTITSWLQSYGFQIARVSNGRTIIEFSGTAGHVQEAFHTSIHKYATPTANGTEEHWANATDPQIPAALAPVVAGVVTLHNFIKKPQHVLSSDKFKFVRKPGELPQFTGTNGAGVTVHAVGPGDLAVIYNAIPLYTASPNINGTGSTLAVVARSNIIVQDWLDFRSNFGLPQTGLNIVVNGPDPGDLGGGEEIEAVLDASYSGALAPSAAINFVVSATTNTTDGVDLSEMYIIDNNLGDVMTESFGGCEEGVGSAESTNISNLAEQAAAQGITYMVSAGDNGSAGCDDPTESVATQGVSVNVLASSAYTVAVGGTMFNDTANPSTYWNTTNTSTLVSAKSYIPEDVWNESCSVAACGSQNANLYAGSGGVSIIFPKPAWQSGVAGIPATGDRNLPDVSLTAAGHDPYLICIEGSCGQGEFQGVGGTSASVQAFGGIMALVRQKINSRAGQADYVFYKLAATETLANCNGSKTSGGPSTSCIFYDTTVGNNVVPGITNGDYSSTVGYDRASGLGSVNITNLVNQWSSVTFAPSVTTLSVNPATFTHGTGANISITVAPKTGTPSFNNEDVSLITTAGRLISDYLLSSTGTVSSSTNTLVGGSYSIKAHYPGNGVLGSSDSIPVALVVSPETSTTVAAALSGSPTGPPFTNGTYGALIFIQGTVTGQSGVGTPTGTLTVDADGTGVAIVGLGSNGIGVSSSAIPTLAVGTHTISAAYNGDASFKPSTSANFNVSITKGPTTLLVQPPGSTAAFGSAITVSIFVDTTSAGTAPSGTVTLFSGSTQIGTSAVAASGIGANGFMMSSVSISVTETQLGPQSLSAQYSGDSNYIASTSPVATVNVLRTTSTTVSPSSPSVQQGQNVTFTAQVASNQSGGPAITGTVQFYLGGIPVGSSLTITNGQAQFATSTLTAGQSGLSAIYSGDSNYESSQGSASFTVTSGPDFNVSFAPPTVNISAPGATGMTMLTVSGSNGFSAPVSFSSTCSNLPSESTCSFSQAMVAVGGSTTLTVSTTAPSSLVPANRHIDFGGRRTNARALQLFLFCAILLALGIQMRRRRWNFTVTALVVGLLIANAACGGSGGGGGSPKNPGTPLVQNQTVTITAMSGSIAHTFTFTVNVN